MKPCLIIVFSLLTLSTLSSCHKDYDCVCTDIDGNQVKYHYKKNTKREATQKCDDWNVSYGVVGGTCSFQNAD